MSFRNVSTFSGENKVQYVLKSNFSLHLLRWQDQGRLHDTSYCSLLGGSILHNSQKGEIHCIYQSKRRFLATPGTRDNLELRRSVNNKMARNTFIENATNAIVQSRPFLFNRPHSSLCASYCRLSASGANEQYVNHHK